MEDFYNQVVAGGGFLGAYGPQILLGLLMLAGLFCQSEAFERLVVSKVRGPMILAYGTFGLPLMLVLMEMQRRRGGGGILRFFGGLILVVIIVILGVLALVAFLLYRFLRRRR